MFSLLFAFIGEAADSSGESSDDEVQYQLQYEAMLDKKYDANVKWSCSDMEPEVYEWTLRDSIGDFKQRICDIHETITFTAFQLSFHGKRVDEFRRVGEYILPGLTADPTFIATLKLQGGGSLSV